MAPGELFTSIEEDEPGGGGEERDGREGEMREGGREGGGDMREREGGREGGGDMRGREGEI